MANKKTETTDKKFRLVSTLCVGAKKIYPDRYVPIKMIKECEKKGEKPNIKAQLKFDDENQKIIVQYLDDDGTYHDFGNVFAESDSTETNSFLTYDKLIDTINQYKIDDEMPEMEATIVGIPNTGKTVVDVEVQIKIYGETAMDKILADAEKDFDSDKLDEMKAFVNGLNLSQPVVTEIFRLAAESLPQDESRVPSKTTFNNSGEVMEDVLYSIASGANTMLSGPMAAGKNTCLETLAYHFHKALYEVQVNSYIDNDVILGTRTIVARDGAANAEEINKQGRLLIEELAKAFTGNARAEIKKGIENNEVSAVETVQDVSSVDFSILIQAMKDAQTEVDFQPGVLAVAMETGSWVVFDEFNAGPPAVMAVLNSVLDNRRRIQIPGYGLVQAAEGFRFFATMNPNYEGTFTLNPATASRFTHILFDASEKISPIITSRVPDAKKEFLTQAEKCYAHIRNGIDTGKMQEDSINVRGYIEAAKMVSMGRSIKRALYTCVVNGITDLDDRKAMKDFIDINIQDK